MESILARGASEGWVLNPQRAKHAQFLVCCRNEDWRNRQDGAAHREAFLIARIAGLKQLTDDPNERAQRFAIEISEYARLAIKEAWEEGVRNPVRYQALEDLGIDLKRVTFAPLPPRKPAQLTISEAKEALAASLGISPDKIEILIRA